MSFAGPGRKSLISQAWDKARDLGTFTVAQLRDAAVISQSSADNYLAAFRRRGLAEEVRRHEDGTRVYAITDQGARQVAPFEGEAPAAAAPADRGSKQANMWRAIRGLPSFSPRDVAVHATAGGVVVSEREATAYCQMLARAGYLRTTRGAIPGKRLAIYRLIRNTGPHAPVERRVRAVWDENEGAFTHLPGRVK